MSVKLLTMHSAQLTVDSVKCTVYSVQKSDLFGLVPKL